MSNLLPGTVEGDDGTTPPFAWRTTRRVRAPRALVGNGTNVNVGVRPEKIRLHEATAEAPAGHNH